MSRPVLIALISALVMLGPFTNNIMVPSLPSIASGLQITFSGAQLILSVFMVGFATGQLFVGPMSDRFGRKPVLVISLSLFVVASSLCGPRDIVGRPTVTGAGRQRLNVGWPRHRPG